MTQADAFRSIFNELRTVLEEYEEVLSLKENTPENYSLDTPYSEEYGRELFFGAVQIKKNYVSYHLMPVYMYPDLLDGLTPSLRDRMHGKSCFNFKTLDPEQVQDLSLLTRQGFERLKAEGVVREGAA